MDMHSLPSAFHSSLVTNLVTQQLNTWLVPMHHLNLDFSLQERHLKDNVTKLIIPSCVSSLKPHGIFSLMSTSSNKEALAAFPEFQKPCNLSESVAHTVRRRTETTDLPVTATFRCPSSEHLAIDCHRFEHMLALGIIRPSSSSWGHSSM